MTMLELAPVEVTEAHEMASENERTYPGVETILTTWLTTKQAVEIISRNSGEPISEQAVRGLCDRKTLFAINLGNQWRIEPASVEAYRKQH
jgi:hypothetical protein